MRALSIKNLEEGPVLVHVPSPQKRPGQAHIRLSHAALNRRDVWITKGHYPNIITPAILGSDGVGELTHDLGTLKKGTRVLICPSLNWGDSSAHQSSGYEILGMPSQGTLAEEICVPEELVFRAPEHLSDEACAALPLAGLTAWRALFSRGRIRSIDRVLVSGIGGGVSSIAALFAIAMGCDVMVTSSENSKIDHARGWGCSRGLNYAEDSYLETLKKNFRGYFDLILDGAGGAGVGALLNTLAPGGRFVFYGGTRGKWPEISPQQLFFKQISLLASTMGSPSEFGDMLNFVCEQKIQPIVDEVFTLTNGAAAFERLESGQQIGKVVISIE